jgi:hypothetical protein
MKNKTKLLNLLLVSIFSFFSLFVSAQITNNSIGSNKTICSGSIPIPLIGSTPSISNCTPGYLSYQWQISFNNSTFSNLSNDTLKNYSFTAALTQKTYYRRIVTHGTCTNTSNTVAISVDQNSVGGTISGNSGICIGSSTGTLTLVGFTGSILNWQKRLNNGSWTSTSNSTATHSEVLNSSGTWEFRVEVQSGVCASIYSNSKYISVYAQPTGGNLSGSKTICIGTSTGTLSLSNYSGTISKWYKNINSTGWQEIANSSSTFSENPNQAGVWLYKVKVTNGTCIETYSNTISISVNPTSVGGSISGSSNICQGSSSGTLSLSGYTGTIQKWQRRFNSGSWIDITYTSSSYSEVLYTAGNYDYRVEIKSGNCNSTFSTIKTVSVAQITISGSVIGGSSICSGDNTNTLTLVGNVGNVLRWEKKLNNSTWQIISNTSQTFSEIPNQPGTWKYRTLVQNGSCTSSYSNSTTVIVDSTSLGGTINGNSNICIGSSTGQFNLINYRGSIVKWQKSNNSGGWYDIPNNNSNCADTPSLNGIWEYRVEIKNGVCPSSFSQIKALQVDALSKGGFSNAISGICIGNNTGYIKLNNDIGTQYNWYSRSPGSPNWILVGKGDSIIDTPTSSGNNLYRAQVINGVCPPDYSSISNVFVFDNTVSGSLSSSGSALCIGSNSVLQLTGQIGSVSLWQKRINNGTWSDINSNSSSYSEILTSNGIFEFRTKVQNGNCQAKFTSPVQILVSDSTIGGFVVGGSEICYGGSTNNLTLIGSQGDIINWERKINNKSWEIVSFTDYLYHEIPSEVGSTLFRVKLKNEVCPDKVSKETKVIVKSIPQVSVGTDKTICLGSSIQLNATGANKYYWNNGESGSSIHVTPNITSNYIVQGINNLNCFGYDTIKVFVNSLPIADFKSGQVCMNDLFTFKNNSLGGNAFNWDFGDGESVLNIGNPSHHYKMAGSYNVKLIAYTIENCSDSVVKEIQVIELPDAHIYGKTEVCKNEPWTRYTSRDNRNHFVWDIIGGDIMDTGKYYIDVHWQNGNKGIVYIVETDNLTGCIQRDSFPVLINNYMALDKVSVIAKANNIKTNILLIPFANYNYYRWGYRFKYFQNSDVTVSTGLPYCEYKFIDTINFYYWVDISNDWHCNTRSYFNQPNYLVSIDKSNSLSEIEQITFNNPVTEGVLELRILSQNTKLYSVSLYSIEGKELYRKKDVSKNYNTMNVSHLSKGIYLLIIASDIEIKASKVIIE